MKKAAIIGAKGFIGRHLTWYLQTKKGITTECYDVLNINEDNYHQVDMTDKASVARINLDVDYIFFMAGITGTKIGFNNYERFVYGNEIALLNLLNAIKESDYRPHIIFPSSRLVYKGVDKALKEDDEKHAKTIYALKKLACENYLKVSGNRFDIPYTIFRIGVPYGNLLDNNYSFGTIGFFLKMATENKNITLYGDGMYKRTFTHMEDLCYQMIEGCFQSEARNEIYNIGGETLSLHEVAHIISEKYNVSVKSIPWPQEDLLIESGHTYFNDEKIQRLLNGYQYHNIQMILQNL